MNVGVMLAAGASRRMGANKSLVRAGGQMFFVRGVRNLWSACDTVVVVLGADARRVRGAVEEEFVRLIEAGALRGDLQSARRQGTAGFEVHMVVNRAWRKGMLGSVRLGLRAALRLKPEQVLVLPVDHPGVKPATVRMLSEAMGAALVSYQAAGKRSSHTRANGFAYALVPRYRRRRGHPVALSPALARAVAVDGGAEDLSDAVRRNARIVGYLDCADAGIVRNRNTPAS
jgi:CTP:molybdopterin cytidylyltransferase MocA